MSAPWNLRLPTSVLIQGNDYNIRTDYRAILDICAALSDTELDGQEKALVAMEIFYPDFLDMPTEHYNDALKLLFWFINCGNPQPDRKPPKLVDWEQDFSYILAPINRVTGMEVRAAEYMHWWTFIAAYYEIGDCTFAQIVRIRDHLVRGKPLDKFDKEWYRNNRHLVDIKINYTEAEEDVLSEWAGKKKTAQ